MASLTRWWRAFTAKRILVIVSVALVALFAGTTVVAFAYDRAESGHFLSGVRIGGVDVGGMSRSEAVAAVRRQAHVYLSHPVTIHAGKKTFHVVPRKLGVTAGVQIAVDRAMQDASSMNWASRSYHRLFGWSVDMHVRVANWLPFRHLRAFANQLAGHIDRHAQSAAVVLSPNEMRAVRQHARPGRSVDRRTVLERVSTALRSMRSRVSIPVKVTHPKVTDRELGKTITIDLTTNTLRLYDGFKVIRTYPVATATSPYSTPIGRWEVIEKEHDPVWINPGSAWAASMPPTIPPGPSNPLGLRALRTSAPGILIHGTPEDWTVGTYASHGCIRMHESDAIALYPLVPMHTPVVIFGAPPWGASTVAGAPPGY